MLQNWNLRLYAKGVSCGDIITIQVLLQREQLHVLMIQWQQYSTMVLYCY